MWTRNSWRLFLGIWLGLFLTTQAGSATAGVIPQALYQKPRSKVSVQAPLDVGVEVTADALPGSAEQPSPAPGPGPVAPGSERQIPSPGPPPSTEEATEVPIGRLEGYEQEKRKAQEIPFQGRPPGAIQEDSTMRRGGSASGSCSHK